MLSNTVKCVYDNYIWWATSQTDRCEMTTASLPAPSLSRHVRLPARWVLLMASNDMIYLILLSIRAAILRARSHFLPELREDEAFGSQAGGRRHSPSSRKILSRSASRSGARDR